MYLCNVFFPLILKATMDLLTLFAITSAMAGVCMAVCQIPQAVKVYREKTTMGISIVMQFILTAGIALWFVSGILLSIVDWRSGLPMMLSNGICLLFSAYILIRCLRDRRTKK